MTSWMLLWLWFGGSNLECAIMSGGIVTNIINIKTIIDTQVKNICDNKILSLMKAQWDNCTNECHKVSQRKVLPYLHINKGSIHQGV